MTIDERQSTLLIHEQRMRIMEKKSNFCRYFRKTNQIEIKVEVTIAVYLEEYKVEEGEDKLSIKLLFTVSNVTS